MGLNNLANVEETKTIVHLCYHVQMSTFTTLKAHLQFGTNKQFWFLLSFHLHKNFMIAHVFRTHSFGYWRDLNYGCSCFDCSLAL